MYYTLFNGETKVLDMQAASPDDAEKQLQALADVFE
jgi:hypothetical protein